MKICNFGKKHLTLNDSLLGGFSFKGAKKRQREKASLSLLMFLVPFVLLIVGQLKIAVLYTGLLLFIIGLAFGYFGVIKKDVNNKFINYLGGWTRGGGIPKTKNIAAKYGCINFILAVILSLILFRLALMM